MSQDPLFGDSLLCHAISKYSWVTGPRSGKDTPRPWTHVEAPNLHVLVQHIDACTAIRLRVIQDTTDLECLPLTTFIREANAFNRRYTKAHLNDLPIFALVRGSSLAIRYTRENNLVRRFQIRFTDRASCQDLVQLLVQHGLKFGNLSSELSTLQSQARPSSSGPYSQSSQTVPLPSSTITVPHIFRGQNQYGMMEQHGDYDSDRPSSLYKTCPERASSILSFPSSPPKVRHTEQQQYEMTGQHANFDSDIYYSESVARPSSVLSPTSRENSILERPMTAPNQQPPATLESMLPPRRELPFPRPSTSSGTPGNPSDASKARALKASTPLPTPSYVRNSYSSTTMAHLNPETNASTSSHARTLRSSSKMAHLNPETGASTPSRPRDLRSSSTLNHSDPVNGGATSSPSSEPVGPKSVSPRGHITLTPTGPWKFDPPANRAYQPRKESYLGSVFTPSSANSTTGGRKGSKLQTSGYSVHIPSSPGCTPASSLMRSDTPYIQGPGDAQVGNGSPVQTDGPEHVKRYSEQTPEVRQEMLEKFLVDHLDDREFITLCEDVSVCWQRKVLDRRD